MTLVVSPHLDDAVLSLGQTIAADPDARVATVFAGVPHQRTLTSYDRACGYRSSADAMLRRRAEDAAAARVLGFTPIHLHYLDFQYRSAPPPIERVARAIDTLANWPREHVVAPLGIGHPDHVHARDAALDAVPERGELLLFEDKPYHVLHAELVAPALDAVRAHGPTGFTIEPYLLPVADVGLKVRAVACYSSQYPSGVDPCVVVPEKCWRAVRNE